MQEGNVIVTYFGWKAICATRIVGGIIGVTHPRLMENGLKR